MFDTIRGHTVYATLILHCRTNRLIPGPAWAQHTLPHRFALALPFGANGCGCEWHVRAPQPERPPGLQESTNPFAQARHTRRLQPLLSQSRATLQPWLPEEQTEVRLPGWAEQITQPCYTPDG